MLFCAAASLDVPSAWGPRLPLILSRRDGLAHRSRRGPFERGWISTGHDSSRDHSETIAIRQSRS
jgi:hypothetical protein